MATRNPFVDNPVVAEVWELGYVAGFAEPETDHFLPLSEELSVAYRSGEQVGRDDRRQLPPPDPSNEGRDPNTEGHSQWAEFGGAAFEVGFVHALGEGLIHIGLKAGGLIALVFEVVQMQTDSPMKALEPEWEGPVDQKGESYLAVCGRTEHAMEPDGVVTDDGYWVGPERQNFREAAADYRRHQHTEAVVVRCSTTDNTCGPVWPLR